MSKKLEMPKKKGYGKVPAYLRDFEYKNYKRVERRRWKELLRKYWTRSVNGSTADF